MIETAESAALPSLKKLDLALNKHGLRLRGGLHAAASDALPTGIDGRPTLTLLLVGNAGAGFWPAFDAERTQMRSADPLDEWTRERIGPVATRFGAAVVFPFEGPPWHPFPTWAKAAGAVWDSPLGLLIHERFGLWHAYRAALLFDRHLPLPQRDAASSPCLDCTSRPCLNACPVQAFDGAGYAVRQCRDWLTAFGGSECMSQGCAARRACPVGVDYRYPPAQAVFHMRAFRDAPI